MAKKKRSKKHRGTAVKPEKERRKSIRLIFVSALAILGVGAAIWFFMFTPPRFNGERAFSGIVRQCDFGPRVPGSDAHQQCGDYLIRELQKYAETVREQSFEYVDKHDSSRIYRGRNIVASFNLDPEKKYRVLLCAHWDSRPFADKDPDSSNHALPVPGANDGASGVAVLLEMARLLHENPLDFGVDIVLFDLEDLGDYSAGLKSDSLNPFCIGSQYFVKNMGDYRPTYGVLLDMIGNKNLKIRKEAYSQSQAGFVVSRVWNAAKRVNAPAFVDETGQPLLDDHIPFLQKGIRVIDLIDFDYPYWHTIADTPDKCSATSLQQVGDVLVELLYGKNR